MAIGKIFTAQYKGEVGSLQVNLASARTSEDSSSILDSSTMKYFEDAVKETSQEADKVLIKKQKDYGSKNILDCPFGPEVGLLVRLYDKISRLANLIKKGEKPSNESLADSWLDIRNYGQIGMMVHKKIFGLPLKNKKRGS